MAYAPYAVNGAVLAYRLYGEYKRQKTSHDATMPLVENAEITRFARKRGRPLKKNVRNAFRLLKSLQSDVTLRFGGVNPYATKGYFKLRNHTDTTAGSRLFPIHTVDISGFVNENGGVLIKGEACPRQWGILSATNLVFNQQVAGQQFTGVQDDTNGIETLWTIENSPYQASGVKNGPMDSSIWKWMHLKMLCYGTTNIPVKYDISIVRFNDDQLNPTVYYDPDTGGVDDERFRAYMDYLVTPYMNNPLSVGSPEFANVATVIERVSFTLQTPDTAAGDTTPHMKEVNLFRRFNRSQRYDWADQSYTSYAGVGTNAYAQQIQDCVQYVAPKHRYVLVIRAQSRATSAAGGGTFTTAGTPSYDLMIRTCHSVVG